MKPPVVLLLAIVGGAIAAYTTVLLVGGATLGILWLWVFGDDPWPKWVTKSFDILLPVGGLVLWAIFGWQIWLRFRGPRSA
ncbi:MAG: hypothetical protein HOP96_07425 [Sphingomonas sp.]|nr:hypothetical protein [Sphingomonas sp.]